jgi:uncharacterized membrane protein YgcG
MNFPPESILWFSLSGAILICSVALFIYRTYFQKKAERKPPTGQYKPKFNGKPVTAEDVESMRREAHFAANGNVVPRLTAKDMAARGEARARLQSRYSEPAPEPVSREDALGGIYVLAAFTENEDRPQDCCQGPGHVCSDADRAGCETEAGLRSNETESFSAPKVAAFDDSTPITVVEEPAYRPEPLPPLTLSPSFDADDDTNRRITDSIAASSIDWSGDGGSSGGGGASSSWDSSDSSSSSYDSGSSCDSSSASSCD